MKDGYTIIATVHSPTSFAFSLFDDLMMLQAGHARWTYIGPKCWIARLNGAIC